MPGPEFQRIKCQILKSQRNDLAKTIESLTDDLLQLSDALA
jgi:hypothetical protein